MSNAITTGQADRWRVYIKPFDETGVYETEWTEVTEDVVQSSLGVIASDLDNTEYDIGIYRNSSIRLTMRNDHGRYSDVDVLQSIFRYRRDGSLVKITWSRVYEPAMLGVASLGSAFVGDEIEVFQGLLNDDSFEMGLTDQTVNFTILGRESVLDKMKVPYGSLSNGDLISDVIYTCLNDSRVTNILTLDLANISIDNDIAVDDVSKFENRTVKSAFQDLLLAGNSVLYIENDSIMVKPRDPAAAVSFSFYGQGSLIGAENIIDIKKIKNGLARVLNLVVWRDTSLAAEDSSSQTLYGVKRKEIALDMFTDNTRRTSILTAIKNEFAARKQEFDLYTTLNESSLAIKLLDRVEIDYPIVYLPGADPLPICGIAICGEAVLPKGLWSFSLSTTTNFKVTGRHVDAKKAQIKLKLREI